MNDVALTFDAERHEYQWQGKRVAHVTGVLQEVMNWSVVPPDLLELGRQRGSAVHALTQSEDEEGVEDWMVPLDLAPYLLAYRAFLRDRKPKWEGIEERVYHKVHGYAGQLDRRGTIEISNEARQFAYIDIKTGAWHEAYSLQLSAYVEAKESRLLQAEPNRYVLQLNNNGDYKLIRCKSRHRDDFSVFLSLLICARWKEKHDI